MLVGGMDFSGNSDSYDKFIAIVIGTNKSISAIFDSIGYDHIHMRNMNPKEKNAIVSKLRFDGKNNIAFCIRVDKNRITSQIQNLSRVKKKNTSNEKIFYAYNLAVSKYIIERLQRFVLDHGQSLEDVIFQCDGDCIRFAKDINLKYSYKGSAYDLSDIVAWCNNRGLEPKGVITLDIRNNVKSALLHDFK